MQLGDDLPSHILVPAIHRNRAEIREIFLTRMAAAGRPAPDDLTDEPAVLAAAAREHLREKFLRARVGVSGANFAVADSGTLVVVESEGNGRMCLTLPEVLVSVVGIEKVLPTWESLDVFLRLLPRSSTGERMNPYTSTWSGVTPGDGPQEVHVVLRRQRPHRTRWPTRSGARRCAASGARPASTSARCTSASAATPTARSTPARSARSSTRCSGAPGDPQTDSLPYASSLCGACFEVCPVRIDIPEVLVHLRSQVVDAHRGRHRAQARVAGDAGGLVDASRARAALPAPSVSPGSAPGWPGASASGRGPRPATCPTRRRSRSVPGGSAPTEGAVS